MAAVGVHDAASPEVAYSGQAIAKVSFSGMSGDVHDDIRLSMAPIIQAYVIAAA